MTSRSIPQIAILAAVALAVLPASPAAADCAPEMVSTLASPADARGVTFTGTYEGPNWEPRVAWIVDHVYAGSIRTGRWTTRTATCMGFIYLDPGERYLFSTAGDGMATWSDSVAWSLLPDEQVELATWIEADRQDYPGSVRRVTTLDEAIELMVPELPPTDATRSRPDGAVPAVLSGTFVLALLLCVATLGWRRTTDGDVRREAR